MADIVRFGDGYNSRGSNVKRRSVPSSAFRSQLATKRTFEELQGSTSLAVAPVLVSSAEGRVDVILLIERRVVVLLPSAGMLWTVALERARVGLGFSAARLR